MAIVRTGRVATVMAHPDRRITHRGRRTTRLAPSRRLALRAHRAAKVRPAAPAAAAHQRAARTAGAATPAAAATVTINNRLNPVIADGPEFFGAVAYRDGGNPLPNLAGRGIYVR
jgi:hypothetical protein